MAIFWCNSGMPGRNLDYPFLSELTMSVQDYHRALSVLPERGVLGSGSDNISLGSESQAVGTRHYLYLSQACNHHSQSGKQ